MLGAATVRVNIFAGNNWREMRETHHHHEFNSSRILVLTRQAKLRMSCLNCQRSQWIQAAALIAYLFLQLHKSLKENVRTLLKYKFYKYLNEILLFDYELINYCAKHNRYNTNILLSF
jgi:predicted transcriptional regulator